jgi:hypothetical protein
LNFIPLPFAFLLPLLLSSFWTGCRGDFAGAIEEEIGSGLATASLGFRTENSAGVLGSKRTFFVLFPPTTLFFETSPAFFCFPTLS